MHMDNLYDLHKKSWIKKNPLLSLTVSCNGFYPEYKYTYKHTHYNMLTTDIQLHFKRAKNGERIKNKRHQ